MHLLNNKGNYVRIPDEIFAHSQYNDLIIPVFIYLYMNRSLKDTVNFSLHDLCKCCGISPSTGKGRSFEKLKQTLKQLFENEYLLDLPNFEKVTGKELCKSRLNIELFDIQCRFALIYLSEIESLLTYRATQPDYSDTLSVSYRKLIRFLTFLRLHQRKYKRENVGEYTMCFRKLNITASELGVSYQTIYNMCKILDQLGIIVSKELPRRIDQFGKWHAAPTVFINKTDSWEEHMKDAKDLIQKSQEDFRRSKLKTESVANLY